MNQQQNQMDGFPKEHVFLFKPGKTYEDKNGYTTYIEYMPDPESPFVKANVHYEMKLPPDFSPTKIIVQIEKAVAEGRTDDPQKVADALEQLRELEANTEMLPKVKTLEVLKVLVLTAVLDSIWYMGMDKAEASTTPGYQFKEQLNLLHEAGFSKSFGVIYQIGQEIQTAMPINAENIEQMLGKLHAGPYSQEVVESIETLTKYLRDWIAAKGDNLERGYFAGTAAAPNPNSPTKTDFFYRAIHLVFINADGEVIYGLIAEVYVPKAQCVGETTGIKKKIIERILGRALAFALNISGNRLRNFSASAPANEG